jgi:hypothetical protein
MAGEYGFMEPIIYTGKRARLLFKLNSHLKEAPELQPFLLLYYHPSPFTNLQHLHITTFYVVHMVQHGSVGSALACCKAGPSVILGSAPCSAPLPHHREVFPTELTSNEEMERGPGEWQRINVLYECD